MKKSAMFPKPMKEDDVFRNHVIFDDGNNINGDDYKQFAIARANALGSWLGENNSIAHWVGWRGPSREKGDFVDRESFLPSNNIYLSSA